MIKKFVLFIVEGKNDRSEIEAILHTPYYASFFDQYKEYFIVTNGDVTAEKGISEKNIQKRLNDILLHFRQGGGPFGNIKVHEIQRIIHVVDMDGVFIPDEAIRREDDCAFRYEDDGIVTSNVDGAIGRNHRKSQILRKLITVEQIGNVPYSVYFVSCNMDHFLFGKRNLSPREKGEKSWQFQKNCRDNPVFLKTLLFDGSIIAQDYQTSWEEIQKNLQSLQREANINLFLNESFRQE